MLDPLNGGKVVVSDGVLYYQKSFPPLYNINVMGMRVSPPSNPKLETYLPAVEWLLPKPKMSLMFDFIRMASQVHKKYKAECEAFIVYYRDRNAHELYYPEQEVESSSCEYDRRIIPEGSIFIAEMHSHHTMSTFFSSTDNKDDAETTDLFPRLSMVFGKMDHFNMMDSSFKNNIKARFSYQGTFTDLNADDIFDMDELIVPDCIKQKKKAYSTGTPYSYYGYKQKTLNHVLIKVKGSNLYNPESYLDSQNQMKTESKSETESKRYSKFFGSDDEDENLLENIYGPLGLGFED